MDQLNDDKEKLDKRESLNLTEDEKVSIRDRIVQKLYKKLEEKDIASTISSMFSREMGNRTQSFDEHAEFINNFDNFRTADNKGAFESSANLKTPYTFSVIRSLLARCMGVLYNPEPDFSVKARNSASADIESDIESYLKYALSSWANSHKGIRNEIEKFVYSYLLHGIGYLKYSWKKKYIKYIDVKESIVESSPQYVMADDGSPVEIPQFKRVESEINKIEKVFEGPCVEFTAFEDVVVIGKNSDDLDNADAVIHRSFLNASDLYTMVETGMFDSAAVNKVIEYGDNTTIQDAGGYLKQSRNEYSGQAEIDKSYDHDLYEILECYVNMDVDDTGINTPIIVWVHAPTNTLLRATYLSRVYRDNKIPIVVSTLYKRSGSSNYLPLGMLELLYPLQKERDALRNMRVDFGLLATTPFGFYRSGSSINLKNIKLSPGQLIPVDDVQDIYFPQLGDKVSWLFQEQNNNDADIERLTSLNDVSFGRHTSAQGIARSAAGARYMMSESSSNLDIIIQHLLDGWKSLLTGILHLLQQNSVEGLEFRITGANGLSQYKKLIRVEDIKGDYDIEISSLSASSNKQLQFDAATQILQMTQNPIALQTGIVTPANVYEAMKNYLKVLGIKDFSKYLNSGMENQFTLLPEEEFNRIKLGMEVQVLPNSDHGGFVNLVNAAKQNPTEFGQLTKEQILLLDAQAKRHVQMVQALQQAQAQAAQAAQQQINSGSAGINAGNNQGE